MRAWSTGWRSIRVRLAVLVFGSLFIAFAAAAGVVYGVHVTDRTVDYALDAQRRLDILTEMSGRIEQYGLVAVAAVDSKNGTDSHLHEAEQAVLDAIGSFEPEIAHAVRAAGVSINANAMATRGRQLQQVRAGFRVLVRQIDAALQQGDMARRGDLVRGAFNGFAALTGPYLFFLMQADRRGVEAGREDARAVTKTLTRAALSAAAVALAVALLLYRLISTPVLAAITDLRLAAVAIGQGERDVRLSVRHHDELGLLAAVFNRMTARLRRGELRVAADRSALEDTVAARTADLREANDKLSEVDRSRRRFFADISHELRTPLTVILGECEIALAGPAAPADATEGSTAATGDKAAFAVIRRRAQRLQRRVEDMLRVARSESGTLELHHRPVALADVASSASEAFEGSTKRKDVAIELVVDPQPVVVTGDFEWLRQIVEAAIDNALRHAAPVTRIRVAVEPVSAELGRLSIADDGPGWGLADPAALLGRFTRRSTGAPGSGIGLALVAWVVDKHGGTVELCTAPAPLGGAEVRIHLPRERPA